MKTIKKFFQKFFTSKSEKADLALIEKWEKENEDGEFSHFYYDTIS